MALTDQFATLLQRFTGTEYRRVVLHDFLHIEAQFRRRRAAPGVAEMVKTIQRFIGNVIRHRLVRLARCDGFSGTNGGGAAKHDEIKQRVGTQTVGPVHGHACGFANRHQARHHAAGVCGGRADDFGFHVGRNAAHVVMHGRQYRDRFLGHIDTGKNTGGFSDTRQAGMDDIGIEMFEVQVNMVFMFTDAATFANFDGHRARYHIARGEVFGARRISFHEAFAFGIGQITALAAHAFGNQAARTVNAGRVELHEFHVLQRQTRAQHHATAITRTGVGGGAGEEGAAITARRQNGLVRAETVQRAIQQVPRHDAEAFAFIAHDQVEGEIFDEEFGLMFQRLLIQRMQHRMARAVGSGAGALRRALAVMRGHAAEGTLVDFTFRRAAERHAVMFQFDDGGNGFLAHILDGILIAQPVRPLDGVVKMEAPVVFAHITERRGDAALRRNRMGTCREYLGDQRGFQALFRAAETGAQTRATGADHDNVIVMICNLIACHLY